MIIPNNHYRSATINAREARNRMLLALEDAHNCGEALLSIAKTCGEDEFLERCTEEFEGGLRKTVAWHLKNGGWIENVRTGAYKDWIRRNYDERIAQ